MGVGWIICKDRLPEKWQKRGDVFVSSRREAKIFGKKLKASRIVKVKKAPGRPPYFYRSRNYS